MKEIKYISIHLESKSNKYYLIVMLVLIYR
jgi:hypothetical protein